MIPPPELKSRDVATCPGFDLGHIPAELRAVPHWVAWACIPRPGGKKPEKRPIDPHTGQAAKVNDPGTWAGFDDALGFYLNRRDRLAGLGFMFAPDGPFAGLDLDGCRSAEGLDPLALDLLRELDTYAEVSPSGSGVKAFGIGRLDPAGPNRSGRMEVYDRGRFFAVTGAKLDGFPAEVRECEKGLRCVQSLLRKSSPPKKPNTPDVNGTGFGGPDDDLLAAAFRAKNGPAVEGLWSGDRRGLHSASEALLSLANRLAFWTGPDPDRLERLLSRSPLWRATEDERTKWESPRPGGGWGRVYIIATAIADCRAFYGGSGWTVGPVSLPYSEASPPPSEETPNCRRHSLQLGTLPNLNKSQNAIPSNPIGTALQRVESGDIPPELNQINSPRVDRRNGLRRLAGVCWILAGRSAGGRFRLSVEATGRVFGVNMATISRWLKDLKARGVIRRTVWGNTRTGLASEWEWVGIGGQASVA